MIEVCERFLLLLLFSIDWYGFRGWKHLSHKSGQPFFLSSLLRALSAAFCLVFSHPFVRIESIFSYQSSNSEIPAPFILHNSCLGLVTSTWWHPQKSGMWAHGFSFSYRPCLNTPTHTVLPLASPPFAPSFGIHLNSSYPDSKLVAVFSSIQREWFPLFCQD